MECDACHDNELTGPILDKANGVVLVGSSNGNLYARLASTGASRGDRDALSVRLGWYRSRDNRGSAGDCRGRHWPDYGRLPDDQLRRDWRLPAADGIIYEASETASGVARLTALQIGNAKGCGSNVLHSPALDDNSYNGIAGYGYVCGTVIQTTTNPSNEPPVLYSFTFPAGGGTIALTGTTLTPPGGNSAQNCSPVTYFTSNSTEKIFMGIGYNNATAGSAVIESNTVSGAGVIGPATQVTAPSSATAGLGGTSGIVVDNASSTASLANVYFTALTAGNVTGGNCQSFTVSGSSAGNTVTLTGTTLNFSAGGTVVVSGFTAPNAAFNGTWALATANATTLTYTVTSIGTIASQAGHTASWGTCAFQLTQSGLN